MWSLEDKWKKGREEKREKCEGGEEGEKVKNYIFMVWRCEGGGREVEKER